MKLWYVISGTKRGNQQVVVPSEVGLEAYISAWKLLKLEDLDMLHHSNAIIKHAKRLEKQFEQNDATNPFQIFGLEGEVSPT